MVVLVGGVRFFMREVPLYALCTLCTKGDGRMIRYPEGITGCKTSPRHATGRDTGQKWVREEGRRCSLRVLVLRAEYSSGAERKSTSRTWACHPSLSRTDLSTSPPLPPRLPSHPPATPPPSPQVAPTPPLQMSLATPASLRPTDHLSRAMSTNTQLLCGAP